MIRGLFLPPACFSFSAADVARQQYNDADRKLKDTENEIR